MAVIPPWVYKEPYTSKLPFIDLLPVVNASAFPAVIPDQPPHEPFSLNRIDNVGFVTFLGNPNWHTNWEKA